VEFEEHLAKYRQKIADSPHIPEAEKKSLAELPDSEFKMWLADQHQKQKLQKPTRHDPYDDGFLAPWQRPAVKPP